MPALDARNLEMRTFGEKLRRLLGASRVTPQELATEIGGVSKSTIYNWCNDQGGPDLKTAGSIARRFGVSLDWLSDDTLDDPPSSPESLVGPNELVMVGILRGAGIGPAELVRLIGERAKVGEPAVVDHADELAATPPAGVARHLRHRPQLPELERQIKEAEAGMRPKRTEKKPDAKPEGSPKGGRR